MARDTTLDLEGTVIEAFRGDRFKVKLTNGHTVLGHISGKMRKANIHVILEDRVTVELSPYDLSKGRIVYRYRD